MTVKDLVERKTKYTHTFGDLTMGEMGLDSLDLIELTLEVEDNLDCKLPDGVTIQGNMSVREVELMVELNKNG